MNGIQYSSLKEVSEKFGQKPKGVRTRLSRGWNLEESLQISKRPKRKYKQSVPLSIETSAGVLEFENIKEAALHFGLKPATVRARLKNSGWSPEMALGITEPPKRIFIGTPVDIIVNDVRHNYESISAAARAMGLSEFLVFGRINRDGWTLEQALELLPPPEHVKKCYGYIYVVTNTKNGKKYVGQTMRYVEERWEQHILLAKQKSESNKNSLATAIIEYGRDAFLIEQVANAMTYAELNELERHWIKKLNTFAPNGYNLNRGGSGIIKGQSITVKGVTYPSISAAAREYDFYDRLVLDRLRKGWSIEQAFEIAALPETHKFTGRTIKVNDGNEKRNFNSIADLARFYNLPIATVMQRLVKLNWTPEEAVGLVPPRKWVHPNHAITMTIDGKEQHFQSKAEVARKYGIKRWSTVAKRIKKGWSVEQALDIAEPPENKFAPVEIQVRINGKEIIYSNQTAAAKAHGISFKKVSARRKLGWSLEEALEIIPRKDSKSK